jgi:polysaccharide biosynthesis protein PslH
VETRFWNKAARVVCVSPGDKQTVENYTKRNDIILVPNGVDTEYFSFHGASSRLPSSFLFVGNFTWPPNIEGVSQLLRTVWPTIRKTTPGATLTIIGKHMPKFLRAMADTQNVAVVDWVEDIRPYYASSTALLAPMGIGGGTKFKILEAMSSGLPVITSEEGASGLGITAGRQLFVSKSTEEYVENVRLVKNRESVAVMTKVARKLVESAYNWDKLAGVLDDVWRSVV